MMALEITWGCHRQQAHTMCSGTAYTGSNATGTAGATTTVRYVISYAVPTNTPAPPTATPTKHRHRTRISNSNTNRQNRQTSTLQATTVTVCIVATSRYTGNDNGYTLNGSQMSGTTRRNY